MAKRLFSFVFLIALLIYSVGLVVLGLAQVEDARSVSCARLEQMTAKNGLAHLVFSRADFDKNIGHRREFWFDNQLFDLKTWSVEGDSVHVLAMADGLELQAIHHLAQLFKIGSATDPAPAHSLPWKLSQFLGQLFLAPENIHFSIFFEKNSQIPTFFCQKMRAQSHLHLFSPPPEA